MAVRNLKPGDIVPVSGLYLIRHDFHAVPKRELIIQGSRVPLCSVCGDAVRYQLESPCIGHRTLGAVVFAAA